VTAARRRDDWSDAQPVDVEGYAPPHDAEHEALVNQAALVVPGFLERVSPPLLAEHFYSAERRIVFEAAQAAQAETGAVNVLWVLEWLRARGHDRMVADTKQFRIATTLLNEKTILTDAEVEQAIGAARSVFDLAHRRTLSLLCQQAVAAMYLHRVDSPRAFYETFEAKASEVCRAALRSSATTTATEGVRTALRDIFDEKAGLGVSTGLKAYDGLLGPLRPGEYTVLGGSTGNGKTALGLTIAGNVAWRGDGVLYVSTADMRAPELMLRLICAWSAVSASRAVRKQLSPREMSSLTEMVQRFDKLPLHIDDALEQSIQEIDAQTRRARIAFERQGRKLKLVVIDYLQRCKFMGASRGLSEPDKLAMISDHAKAIAGRHETHVIALVQIWPPAPASKKDGGDGKPDVDNIKGSKSIPQPASTVGFIHREKGPDGRYPMRGRASLVVRKSRWGSQYGEVPMIFDGPLTRFEDDPTATVEDYHQ
jgi:replicative DNA helicase